MVILGIDPGLAVTGYAAIEAAKGKSVKLKEAGVIKTRVRDGIATRLEKLYRNLEELIKDHKPEVVVLEKLYSHYRHPVTAILMGHARGIVCLACGFHRIKLVNYPSTKIKKSITGKGHASKRQVQCMVRNRLGLKSNPEPLDVSDALASALTYVNVELR